MKRLKSLACCFAGMFAATAVAQDDPGKAEIGRIQATVYFGSDTDASKAGPKAKMVSADMEARLRGQKNVSFKEYRLIGQETQPVFRSYENWAQPLRPSDEVLIRVEAQGKPVNDVLSLDVELWFSRKKALKTDARIAAERPLIVLGPEWRGGHLIIAVSLAPKNKPGS